MNQTTHAFRLIITRARQRQPDLLAQQIYSYHAVASNWPTALKTAHAVLGWHHQRGQAEHVQNELQVGFGLERLPCGEAHAHAVSVRLGVLAYDLFIGFRRPSRVPRPGPRTPSRRSRLIQVAGRIVRHAGPVILTLVVEAETLNRFHQIRRQCLAFAEAT